MKDLSSKPPKSETMQALKSPAPAVALPAALLAGREPVGEEEVVIGASAQADSNRELTAAREASLSRDLVTSSSKLRKVSWVP